MPRRPRNTVVLDTNVLVSSLWRGRCWDLVRLWDDGRFTLVTSPAVLREYLEVLSRFVGPDQLRQWAEVLTDPTRVMEVEPTERLEAIQEDPADNRFLECAVAARANAIVSGDHHLLALKTFRGIPILTPAIFLRDFAP